MKLRIERKRTIILIMIPLLLIIYFNFQALIQVRSPQISDSSIKSNGIPNRLIYTRKQPKSMNSWKSMNPDMELSYYDNDMLEKLLQDNLQVLPAFVRDKIKDLVIIEKADLFRYVATYLLGGVYADCDVEAVQPLSKWVTEFKHDNVTLEELDFIFGIEFLNPQKLYLHTGLLPFQLTQFTFASARGSFIMKEIIELVAKNLVTVPKGEQFVLQRTGPAVFSRAIIDSISMYGTPSGVDDTGYPLALMDIDTLNKEGQLITLCKDVCIKGLILPYRAFAYHPFHKTGEVPTLSVHHYAGSWKSA